MNDELKAFCNNMGVLIETWWLTYSKFRELGLSVDDALMHTKAFMESICKSSLGYGG